MTNDELVSMKTQVTAMQTQIAAEERRRTDERYRQNITNLGITLDKVELSDSGDGKPWFAMLPPFLEWCEKNSKKPFMEWNTLVYLRSHVDMNNPLCKVDMLEGGK